MSPEPVEYDPFSGPLTAEKFAAAILTNGPIRVKADAVMAVQRNDMVLSIWQEWDEETRTMTYFLPEGASAEEIRGV